MFNLLIPINPLDKEEPNWNGLKDPGDYWKTYNYLSFENLTRQTQSIIECIFESICTGDETSPCGGLEFHNIFDVFYLLLTYQEIFFNC